MSKRAIIYEQVGQTGWMEPEDTDAPSMLLTRYTGNNNRVESALYHIRERSSAVVQEARNEDADFDYPEGQAAIDGEEYFEYVVELLRSVPSIWRVKVIEV